MSNPGRRRGADNHRRGGQVLVMLLLSLVTLVGLIFYVYNTGDTVNRRLDLQSAADATAVSGATWMARSMNLIAANNIAEARLICLACVLDSLPLATEMTVVEEDEVNANSLTAGLETQLKQAIPNTNIERFDVIRVALQRLLTQMTDSANGRTSQLDGLRMFDNAFNSVEERTLEAGAAKVEGYTHWKGAGGGGGAGPSGAIWQAIVALDALSQATADSAGVMAQADAQRFGQANQASTAILTPLLPRLPARRGAFSDYGPVLMDSVVEVNAPSLTPPQFRHQVSRSNLVQRFQGSKDVLKTAETARCGGGAIPDYAYPQRLGPFARLMMWRNFMYSGWVGGTPGDTIHTGNPEYDNSSQTVGGTGGTGVKMGYSTYGPMQWAMNVVLGQMGQVGRTWDGALDTTRFAHHLRRVSMVKLAEIFGLSSPQPINYPSAWMTNFDEAKVFAKDPKNANKILRTQYYRATVKSTRKWDDTLWLRTPREYFTTTIDPLNQPNGPPAPDAEHWVWQGSQWDWYDIEKNLAARKPGILLMKKFPIPGQTNPDGTQKMTDPVPAIILKTVEWERCCNFVWRIKQEFQVDHDPNLGLALRQNADGTPILWTTYSVGWYIFRGCELRDPVQVYNPADWGGGAILPSPMLVDTSAGDYNPDVLDPDSGVRRASFTFLGTARKDLAAQLWPAKFYRTVQAPASTFAQAKVFNNRSWDLWTQDWQVQLMPVTQWQDWRQRLTAGEADLSQLTGLVDPVQVRSLEQFLTNMPSDGMDLYTRH